MPGLSIHVGAGRLDAATYGEWPRLAGCEAAAQAMFGLAAVAGFEPRLITGEAATAVAVLDAIRSAGERMSGEDILLLTYYGHGTAVPCSSGVSPTGYTQAWCLHDRRLATRELHEAWLALPWGARVVVVSDSCFSGRIIRSDLLGRSEPEMSATVLLLAAAGTRQLAVERRGQGLFTSALLEAWQDGAFQGSYQGFFMEIVKLLEGKQRPAYYRFGLKNPEFEAQRPFTIAPPGTV